MAANALRSSLGLLALVAALALAPLASVVAQDDEGDGSRPDTPAAADVDVDAPAFRVRVEAEIEPFATTIVAQYEETDRSGIAVTAHTPGQDWASPLVDNTADVLLMTRLLTRDEVRRIIAARHQAPRVTPVGRDALGLLIDRAYTSIGSLPIAALRRIYIGETTNWRDLNGDADEVQPTLPPAGSIMEATVLNALFGADREEGDGVGLVAGIERMALGSDLVGRMRARATDDAGLVGFASFCHHRAGPTVMPIEREEDILGGTAANAETMAAGTYPLRRVVYVYSLGEPLGATARWLAVARAEATQEALVDAGFFRLDD